MRLALCCSVICALGCRQLLGLDDPAVLDGGSGKIDASGDGRFDDASRDGSFDAPVQHITFVQGNKVVGPDSSSATLAYESVQQAGDLNLVAVAWVNAGSLNNLTDSAGNTYLRLGPAVGHGTRTQVIYMATNIAAGTNTVTATFAASVTAPELRILEYAGLATTNVIDHSSLSTGSTAAVSGGPVTTTHAHDLIVGFFVTDGAMTSADPLFKSRVPINGDIIEDREVMAAGAYSANATQAAPASWIMYVFAFAAAP